MIAAMIERAVLDRRLSERKNKRAARKWLTSPSIAEWSFVWCCEQLGRIDLISAVRQKLFSEKHL